MAKFAIVARGKVDKNVKETAGRRKRLTQEGPRQNKDWMEEKSEGWLAGRLQLMFN